MQISFSPRASSMASNVVLHEAEAPAQPVEVGPEAKRPLDGLPGPSASERTVAVPNRTLRERLRRPLLIAFLAALSAIGAAYYLTEEPFVSTDDAFIRAAKDSINARVSGQVVK